MYSRKQVWPVSIAERLAIISPGAVHKKGVPCSVLKKLSLLLESLHEMVKGTNNKDHPLNVMRPVIVQLQLDKID